MEFQAVSGPKFTGPFSTNAEGIARDHISFRFSISSPVPEIFAVKVRSGRKLPEILHVLPPPHFFGRGECPPPRIFGLNLSNLTSFRSCGKVSRRSVEGARRDPGERKNITGKTEDPPFYRTGGLKTYTESLI